MSESGSHNPCATCGVCCRSYLVSLSGYDVWRISTSQRLAPEQFTILVEGAPRDSRAFQLQAGGPIYELVLDKKGRPKLEHACTFLVPLAGGQVRCGIYADRPVVCHSYPMVDRGGEVAFREKALCPPGSWPADEPRRATWRRAIARADLHFDLYLEVANRWNARVNAAPDQSFNHLEYFSYLLNVYSRLAALDEVVGPELLAKVAETWGTAPSKDANLAELRDRTEDFPWVNYLFRARAIVDRFYPGIPPLPLHEPVIPEEGTLTRERSINAQIT